MRVGAICSDAVSASLAKTAEMQNATATMIRSPNFIRTPESYFTKTIASLWAISFGADAA